MAKFFGALFLLASIFAASQPSTASHPVLKVIIEDPTHAAFPGVLVIVKSLENGKEVFRALTDDKGTVPERHLLPGLYRAIATCPYGICQTKVKEFLAGDESLDLTLILDFLPPRGNVVNIGIPDKMNLTIRQADAKPAAGAQLLVRDSNAFEEKWYMTDHNGKTEIEPLGDRTTVVVLYKGKITENTYSAATVQEAKRRHEAISISLDNGFAHGN